MLIIFHCVVLIIKHFIKLKLYITKNSVSEKQIFDVNTSSFALLDVENIVKFDPPVYKQRYGQVYTVLLDEKWRSDIKKVVDFGCAEFGLFMFLKRLTIQEILFVDIDKSLLEYNLFKILPLTYEYLDRRNEPLTAQVLSGSISDPDNRLLNTDAVIAVEIIEHLYPDTLDALPYNIFSFIQPKLVIVTTPNADFNVLFQRKGFRHYDHKFEWTRKQFEEWAENITLRFTQYSVHFVGIGSGPENSEHLGSCSQMAVFIKSNTVVIKCTINTNFNCDCDNCRPKSSYGICTYHTCSNTSRIINNMDKNGKYYHLIESIEYPYEIDTRSEEDKIMDELRYRINMHCNINSRFFNEENYRFEVPLTELVYSHDGQFLSTLEARKLLTKFNYHLEECRNNNTGDTDLCVTYEMDNSTTSSDGYQSEDASRCDSERDSNVNYSPVLSDWDDDPKIQEDSKTYKLTGNFNTECRKNKTSIAKNETKDSNVQESLIDSGYQKSLTESPVTPLSNNVVKDTFHSATFLAGPSICILNPSSTNKDVIAAVRNEISLVDLTALDSTGQNLDYDRINELDSFSNQSQYYHFAFTKPLPDQCLKPDIPKAQFLKENAKISIAGPSEHYPVSRKKKRLSKSSSSDSNDSTIDDIKSITTCLLENTLNFIESNKEPVDLIEGIDEPDILPVIPLPYLEPNIEVFPIIVENGDLVNNNRDFEGNNYPQQEDDFHNMDVNNVNINGNLIDNILNEGLQVEEIADAPIVIEEIEDGVEDPEEVEQASREALFDPNSQEDLLDDIDIPDELSDATQEASPQSNIMLIGVNINRNEDQLGNFVIIEKK